jgi:hypothetical protein
VIANRRPQRGLIYGDYPNVPREMRPARRTNSEGGESGTRGRAVTRTNRRHGSHDHDGTGL